MPTSCYPTGQIEAPGSTAAPEPPWTRGRLRVPQDDESLFARPELSDAAGQIRENHQALDGCSVGIQGRTLHQLREWSRKEVMRAAREYTSWLVGQPLAETPAGLLLAGGHQPALFHPGVWVKNFALGALAQQVGGTALNLIVDNDTLSTSSISVPTGDRRRPIIEAVPFDDTRPTQPWEDAQLVNRQLFESFGQRVSELMSAWNIEPLLGEMWPDAVNTAAAGTASLRDCLTAARHFQERRWGLANWELPISRLCQLDPFLWFASHLFAQLPRFREVHNRVLVEYRQVNRIRSRTHPVPQLSAEPDGWLEAPFWVWQDGDHQRQRVYAKQVGREIHLSNGSETFAHLPLTPDGEACCAVEALRELPQQGIRLRTRALTTTLFARLCFSDLFIHGVGGSKYDEMTDRIISRFYRLPAPSFLTLSATLHLPLAAPFAVTADDELSQQRLLRELQYNSDRHLSLGMNATADALIAEKRQLIAEQHRVMAERPSHIARQKQLRENLEELPLDEFFPKLDEYRKQIEGNLARSRENHQRYREFQEIDRRLTVFTTDQRSQVERDLQEIRHQVDANTVLTNREFAFCLHPADKLRKFMSSLPVSD